MIHTEGTLTLTCIKCACCWHTERFKTVCWHTVGKSLPNPAPIKHHDRRYAVCSYIGSTVGEHSTVALPAQKFVGGNDWF